MNANTANIIYNGMIYMIYILTILEDKQNINFLNLKNVDSSKLIGEWFFHIN